MHGMLQPKTILPLTLRNGCVLIIFLRAAETHGKVGLNTHFHAEMGVYSLSFHGVV